MIVQVPQVLSPDQVAHCRRALEGAAWADGRITAGVQSARAKRNLQVPEDSAEARTLGEMILGALGRNETFVSAALPLRVFPPLFNRYDAGMGFGAHVDNAIRFAGGVRFRTDVSATLFLSGPEDYDGGELVIDDAYGEHAVKLAAGDMILYPAAFFWAQSMVRDDGRRSLLYDMDRSIGQARAALSDDHPAVLGLTAGYHNLLRMWAET